MILHGLHIARQASLSFIISQSSLKLRSIELVLLSNHLNLCCPLLFLPSIFPSIMVFSNELALHIRWPKYWSFSFIISPSNEYLGLISLMIDWFDLCRYILIRKKTPYYNIFLPKLSFRDFVCELIVWFTVLVGFTIELWWGNRVNILKLSLNKYLYLINVHTYSQQTYLLVRHGYFEKMHILVLWFIISIF